MVNFKTRTFSIYEDGARIKVLNRGGNPILLKKTSGSDRVDFLESGSEWPNFPKESKYCFREKTKLYFNMKN